MLTQNRLIHLVDYHEDSGNFVWKNITSNRVNIGDIVGNIAMGNEGKKYRSTSIDGKRYLIHRLVWLYVTGSFPKHDIDHINGNGLDNRFCNLRSVTRAENQMNVRRRVTNTSGLVGVSFVKNKGYWFTYINRSYKRTILGYFDNIFDAACARISAQQQYGFHKNHGSDRNL